MEKLGEKTFFVLFRAEVEISCENESRKRYCVNG